MKARKLLALGLTAIIGATMMAGCGGGGGSTTSQSSDGSSASGTYAFVAKDVQNPYMQKVYDGFEKACKETEQNLFTKVLKRLHRKSRLKLSISL